MTMTMTMTTDDDDDDDDDDGGGDDDDVMMMMMAASMKRELLEFNTIRNCWNSGDLNVVLTGCLGAVLGGTKQSTLKPRWCKNHMLPFLNPTFSSFQEPGLLAGPSSWDTATFIREASLEPGRNWKQFTKKSGHVLPIPSGLGWPCPA